MNIRETDEFSRLMNDDKFKRNNDGLKVKDFDEVALNLLQMLIINRLLPFMKK